ncbi:hypothetical protein M2271_006966 [Streptomyces sp. LBL]|uniref:hypothetical protein n=1 Tax=Streptomyces sp. LBL TaxID=2940562 RepID=UPI00247C19F9|nr:hypothetical protein [Streptomyces sp. LBL]
MREEATRRRGDEAIECAADRVDASAVGVTVERRRDLTGAYADVLDLGEVRRDLLGEPAVLLVRVLVVRARGGRRGALVHRGIGGRGDQHAGQSGEGTPDRPEMSHDRGQLPFQRLLLDLWPGKFLLKSL